MKYIFWLVLISSVQLVFSVTDCPNQKFGANCAKDCHCYYDSSCDNRDTSSGCTKNGPLKTSCDKGYKNPPGCQSTCGAWKYGVNCALDCHCHGNQTSCDRIQGNCFPDALCARGWFGPGCQLLLPVLSNPPALVHNNCSGLLISWPSWRSGTDQGIDAAVAYELEMKASTTGSWTVIKPSDEEKVQELDPQAVYEHLINFGEISASDTYQFRVTCIWEDGGGAKHPGKAGPATVAVRPQCIQPTTTTPPPSTTPLTTTGPPTANNLEVKVTKFALAVTWNNTDNVIKYLKMTMQPVMLGDCQSLSGSAPTVNEVAFSVGKWEFNGQPWTKYEVTIVALDASKNQLSELLKVERITEETAPTGAPSVRAAAVGESWLAFRFFAPPCASRGGVFLWHQVQALATLSGKTLTDEQLPSVQKVLNSGILNVTSGVTAYTKYRIVVKYVNKVNPGPSGSVELTTRESVPASPVILDPSLVNATSVEVSWRAPSLPLANIKSYEWWLLSGGSSGGSLDRKGSLLSSAELKLVLNELAASSQYIFRVRSVGDKGKSAYSEKKFITPSLPTQVQNLKVAAGTSSSLKLTWQHPEQADDIFNYRIRAVFVNSLLPESAQKDINKNVDVSLSKATSEFVFSDLAPATQWKVEVMVNYTSGHSTSPPSVVSTWTAPTPIDAVHLDGKIKVSANGVSKSSVKLLLAPVTSYIGGPISTYYILVKKAATVAATVRRRRALSSDFCVSPLKQPCDWIAAKFSQLGDQPFLLGEGNSLGGQENKELNVSTKYFVYLAVTSEVPGRPTEAQSTQVTVTTSGDAAAIKQGTAANAGLIIGLIFLFLLLAALLVLLLLCLYRRGYIGKPALKSPVHAPNGSCANGAAVRYLPKSHNQWSHTEDVKEARVMVLDPEFGPRDLDVHQLSPDSGISYETEYHSLPQGLQHPCTAGRRPENSRKNRSPSILPYDHCRVTLERAYNSRESDYINASFIDGYLRRRAYIAAQSPQDAESAADFWLMISQQNVAQVVMLCEPVEDTILKSTVYWPSPVGKQERYAGVTVVNEAEENRPYWVRRKFRVDGATVEQFCFKGWPEHGVPDSPLPLVGMYTAVKAAMKVEDGPLLVHCGTGVSRSAVFIALDSLLQQATHESCVNVMRFCSKMRRARPNMIRTPRQYVFLYDAVFEALMSGGLALVNSDVRDAYDQLSAKNPRTGQNYLWEQQALLEKYTPRPGPCNDGLDVVNENKNRIKSAVPPDRCRVRLRTPGSSRGATDYINAVWVDGWSSRQQIVLTQTPLAGTVEDFWRMLWDYGVSVVVDMQPDVYAADGEEAAVWWPPRQGDSLRLGSLLVNNMETQGEDSHLGPKAMTLRLLSENCINEEQVISVLRPNLWTAPYDKAPNSKSGFTSLIRRVIEMLESTRSPGPVVFMCPNGAERSGLAAICLTVAGSLNEDGYVDVFHTVRWMKLRRHQIIPHLDQYKFIFRFLHEWVRSGSGTARRSEMRLSQNLSTTGHLDHSLEESIYTHSQTPILHRHGEHGEHDHHVPLTNYHYANDELLKTV